MNNSDETESTEKPVEPAATTTEEKAASSIEQELENTRKKAAENYDLFLRARADADNFRRRSAIDLENAHKYGTEKFAKEILAVVDSLDHGLAAGGEGNEQALKDGMKLTLKLLLDTLDKFGIKMIDPMGEAFDPMRHEALSAMVNKEVEPNKILVVVQKGFTQHDRLLRPARVIVSRAD